MAKSIANFLDSEGRLRQFPAKQTMQREACAYLAGKFAFDTDYTEHEVNAILNSWHSFGDYFVLRRYLVGFGLLNRERDGSRYWRPRPPEEAPGETSGQALESAPAPEEN